MSDHRGDPGPSDAPGASAPHGAHGRTGTTAEKWAAFKESPFFPACVLVLILAAAAGLFAGSYTYAMANPTPRHIPTAVVGSPAPRRRRRSSSGWRRR